MAQTVRGGGWRVDKLANRTSFLRQLNALQDMVEVKAGTSQKAGVDPAIRDILVAGWDHNRADINAIPDMCSAERHENPLTVNLTNIIWSVWLLQLSIIFRLTTYLLCFLLIA